MRNFRSQNLLQIAKRVNSAIRLRLRGVRERLALGVAHGVAFPLSGQGWHAEVMISELNGWPACALVNASPVMLP